MGVPTRGGERRLDESHPTTERNTIYDRSEPPDKPEVRNGVKFVLAVSLLRWKLWRKAKQEPKFRFYALYDRIYRFDVLVVAWLLVWENNGKPGVDDMSCQDILDGPGAGQFLRELAEELRSKRYRPTTRQAGDDPEGQRRRAAAGHSDRQGPDCPDGDAARSGTDLRSGLP
jgi:hypothetical protein